jgi:nucleoid-associated protein YgaU
VITTDSRYRTATLQTVTGSDGTTRQEMRVPFPRSRVFSFTYYRIKASDRVDVLAHQNYGNGRLWWMIADANPEILDWTDLVPGTIIRVPNA